MADFIADVALGESLTPVGQLRFTHVGPRQFSTFSYSPIWIGNPRSFAIQPDLSLEAGPFHRSGQLGNMPDALAGVFADAAPDSWGRRLLERAYGNGLNEFEYLTLSDDASRQGALRFLDDRGEVIRGNTADAVPRLVDLETITAIARAYEQGKVISAEEMQALAGLAAPAPRPMSGTAMRYGWRSSPRCTINSRLNAWRWPPFVWRPLAASARRRHDWNWRTRRSRLR